jgi:biopolymer transport protein ExbB/TolQ
MRSASSARSGSALPVLAALILGLVLQQLLNTVIPVDSYAYRLFRPAGGWFMGIIPGVIAFVFIWAIVDLALKLRTALRNERDLERPEVRRLPAVVSQEASRVTLQRLRGWDRGLLARPVGRRMLWLLRHLDSVDARRAHELVRHQADLDADSAASGYRAVKLFVWAMPILGFIGTVLGISLAVGGFSEFLTTNVSIDEIDTVTSELGNVASGLSFAFDTTLLGLMAGLVSNVCASAVQGREERFITGLEELGLRIMSEAPAERPAEVVAEAEAAEDGAGKIDELVRAHLEELSMEMDQFTYTVRRGLQSLNEASARISRGMESSIESVNETMDELGIHVRGTTERLARNMETLEAANRRLATTLSALAPVLGQLTGPMEVRLMPKPITPPPASAPAAVGPTDTAQADTAQAGSVPADAARADPAPTETEVSDGGGEEGTGSRPGTSGG